VPSGHWHSVQCAYQAQLRSLREGRVGLEKGECKIAEGGDRSFWRQNEPRVLFLVSGDPVDSEELPNFKLVAMKVQVPTGSESSKFPVERTLGGYLPPLPGPVGWRPEDGGGGSRQEWASASGGTVAAVTVTVQSDQRRGASEPPLQRGCAYRADPPLTSAPTPLWASSRAPWIPPAWMHTLPYTSSLSPGLNQSHQTKANRHRTMRAL
jgi:hypothetical protein